MNDFAFYLSLNEIGYYKAIIENMPKEILDIHVDTNGRSFGDLDPEFRDNIDGLLDDKYNVLQIDPAKLQRYKFAVMSSQFFSKRQTFFDWKKDRRSGLACLYHSTDAPVGINNFAASHYILAHQR